MTRNWLLRFRLWREFRRRRAEEFRLFSIAQVTSDPADFEAWQELRDENHHLGVW